MPGRLDDLSALASFVGVTIDRAHSLTRSAGSPRRDPAPSLSLKPSFDQGMGGPANARGNGEPEEAAADFLNGLESVRGHTCERGNC